MVKAVLNISHSLSMPNHNEPVSADTEQVLFTEGAADKLLILMIIMHIFLC